MMLVIPIATDQVIATDIINAINGNYLLNSDDVDVKVKNGVVTLSSELSTRALCRSALEFEYNTYGVKGVKD